MVPLGSKKDRHQHLGQGEIGIEFFRKLINDKRFKDTPVIMETPDEDDMDIKNIKLMKSLRGQ
jgi:deoxyribonuclease-4